MKAILVFDLPLDENDEDMTIKDIRQIQYHITDDLHHLWVHFKRNTENGDNFTFSNDCKLLDMTDFDVFKDGTVTLNGDGYETERELIEAIIGDTL